MIHLVNKTQVNWLDILRKFSSYEGTIAEFCTEHSIKIHQFYYHRRKAKKNELPVLHGIKVSEKDFTPPGGSGKRFCLEESAPIQIEIGKAKIYIPSNDREALENILQIVISIC